MNTIFLAKIIQNDFKKNKLLGNINMNIIFYKIQCVIEFKFNLSITAGITEYYSLLFVYFIVYYKSFITIFQSIFLIKIGFFFNFQELFV